MMFLPDWAPNLHPLIVHFPIALLIIALIFEVLALIFSRNSGAEWLRYAAGSLYIAGAVSALFAYITGRLAADSVNVPATANPTLTEHADLALYTTWFFGIYGVVRLFLLWQRVSLKWAISFLIFLIGAAGMYLLYETAEHGAEMVFRHGVGVHAAERARQELAKIQEEREVLEHGGIVEEQNGSWKWDPGEGAEIVLREQFNWLIGSPATIGAESVKDEAGNQTLALNFLAQTPAAQSATVLFTAGKPLKSVQAEAKVNLNQFRGRFMLVHHVQDSLNYDFVSLENDRMKLGRLNAGKEIVQDEGVYQASGWLILRSVGDGTHFRGYVNEKMITHGHLRELPPGPVGFFIEGSGIVLLDEISVISLR